MEKNIIDFVGISECDNEESNLKFNLRAVFEMFTEEEKVILRNVRGVYNFIARNEDGDIYLFICLPKKLNGIWLVRYSKSSLLFDCFNHLFKNIKWEDDEPVEFREYL